MRPFQSLTPMEKTLYILGGIAIIIAFFAIVGFVLQIIIPILVVIFLVLLIIYMINQIMMSRRR